MCTSLGTKSSKTFLLELRYNAGIRVSTYFELEECETIR